MLDYTVKCTDPKVGDEIMIDDGNVLFGTVERIGDGHVLLDMGDGSTVTIKKSIAAKAMRKPRYGEEC